MRVERDGGASRILRLSVPVVEVVAERVRSPRVQQRRVRRVRARARRQQTVHDHVRVSRGEILRNILGENENGLFVRWRAIKSLDSTEI